ncbi:MAG: hypothetical protein ACJ73E_07180 [Mycobacteriales bacterium]
MVLVLYRLKILDAQSDEQVEDTSEQADPSIADVSFEMAALFDLEMRDGDEALRDEELGAYAREYIYDVTGRLGLPPLTLQVLRRPVPGSKEPPIVGRDGPTAPQRSND